MSTVATTDNGLATGLHLLEAGIPLSLLLDLAVGPRSHDLYQHEDADLDWVPDRQHGRLAG